MTPRTAALIVLTLLAAAPLAPAQEKYTIKLRVTDEDEPELVERTETESGGPSIIDMQGKATPLKTVDTKIRYVYRETLLDRPSLARPPVKLKRHYTTAETTTDGKTTTLPLQGKTVLIEKKGARYHFQVEGGGELAGPAAAPLDQEFNKKQLTDMVRVLVPARAVAVGDTWKIDAGLLTAAMKAVPGDFAIDPTGVTITGKLLKAYRQDGKQFGVLRLEIVVPLKSIPYGKETVPLEKGAKMVLSSELDGCIDGSSTAAAVTNRIAANVSGPIPNLALHRMQIRMNNATTERRRPAPP